MNQVVMKFGGLKIDNGVDTVMSSKTIYYNENLFNLPYVV